MNSFPDNQQKKHGPGCWIAILAVLLVVAVGAVLIYQPIRQAKHTEQLLNDRLGEAVQFMPDANGSIPPQRMEAFLRVREKVFEHCPEFQERIDDLMRLGVLEEEADTLKTVSARESISGLKKLFGFGSALLRFINTRNLALLEEEMGMGEYEYIYCLSYRENLRRIDQTRFAGMEEAYVGDRARRELIRILGNQLEALMAGDIGHGDADLASSLREQIAAMQNGDQSLPWEDGLPPSIAASLAPYAGRLSQCYCEGIARLELMQKNKGFAVSN